MPLVNFNPAACQPCVRPAAQHAAPATAVSARLEHVENRPRRDVMPGIRQGLANIGNRVLKAFDRLVNPKKETVEARSAVRDVREVHALRPMQVLSMENLLRGVAWKETNQAVDALQSMIGQKKPVSPVVLQGAFDRLVVCLKLFQEPEGMGLSADGRKAFATLLDAPIVHELRADPLATPMRDISQLRAPLLRFVDQVKGALREHAADHQRHADALGFFAERTMPGLAIASEVTRL